MKKYKLLLTKDQLQTVLQALELKSRIGIGQFNEIWWQLCGKMFHDSFVEGLADRLATELGLKNLGIGNDKVNAEAKRCWDIFQVLRKKWADDHVTGWSVWKDGPLFLTDVRNDPPLIVADDEPLPGEQETSEAAGVPSGTKLKTAAPRCSASKSYAKSSRASGHRAQKDRDRPQRRSRD